jgi:hypothetical protein
MDESDHRAMPWRVHTLAPDFKLEDVWTIRLEGHVPRDVREFVDCFWGVFRASESGFLARVRMTLGRWFGWDDHDFSLAIPGCTEKSVGDRLTSDDRSRSLAGTDAPSPISSPQVRTVYVFDREALFEFSNDTIHGMLHVSIEGDEATVAVYVKHRGLMSRLYMAAIWPARHLLIYPAFVRSAERAWAAAA